MSTGCQKDRKTGQQRDRKTGRKTEILFSLVIKTKVVKNVNKKDKTESHQARIAGQLKTSLLFLHHCHLYLWHWAQNKFQNPYCKRLVWGELQSDNRCHNCNSDAINHHRHVSGHKKHPASVGHYFCLMSGQVIVSCLMSRQVV